MGGVQKAVVILRCGKVLLLRERTGSSSVCAIAELSRRPRLGRWCRQGACSALADRQRIAVEGALPARP